MQNRKILHGVRLQRFAALMSTVQMRVLEQFMRSEEKEIFEKPYELYLVFTPMHPYKS